MLIIKRNVILLLVCFVFSAQSYASDLVKISNAWVPEAPPVIKVMAGYLVAENTSDKPVSLMNVSSSEFNHVEMHKSILKDGMAQMVKQDKVTISAKSKVEFKSGGLHLMLMGAKKTFTAGSKIPLVLEFDNGEKQSVVAIVKPAGADSMMDHSHHHH